MEEKNRELNVVLRWKGRKVKHFKGKEYLVQDIALHTETGEHIVVYRALYGNCKLYARPLKMFMSKTDKVKHPEATQEYRFELVVE